MPIVLFCTHAVFVSLALHYLSHGRCATFIHKSVTLDHPRKLTILYRNPTPETN